MIIVGSRMEPKNKLGFYFCKLNIIVKVENPNVHSRFKVETKNKTNWIFSLCKFNMINKVIVEANSGNQN